MRFLNLVQRYAPAVGGSEWYMRKLSESLVASGHRVKVLTTTAIEVDALWRWDAARTIEGPDNICGVEIHRLPQRHLPFHGPSMTLLSFSPVPEARFRFSMPGPLLPGIGGIAGVAGDYDIVHATALPFTSIIWAGWKLAKRKNVPFIVTPFMHFGVEDRLGYGYRKKYQIDLLSKADAVITVTPTEREGLIKMGLEESRVGLIELGIDETEMPTGDPVGFRKRHGLDGPIVFNMSARTLDKGAIHTVEAMRLLWKSGVEAHLVMAGPSRPDYRKYVDSLPGPEKARILDLGVLNERGRADLFAAGDVMCMPSRAESFGLVYLEAWHYGAAVVAARVGAVPDVVSDGVDGHLVDFGDVEAIAASLKHLIENTSTRGDMAAAGRKKIAEKMNWKKTFSGYTNLVAEVTGEKISG